MKITFVRHAEVIKEYQGKYNGHLDMPLSENGKLQAKALAKELFQEDFDKVYCSDLLRTRETLEAFSSLQTPIFTNRLREKSWGIHEGKSFEEIEQSGIYYENFEQWIHALDGENIDNYTRRLKDYFETVLLKETSQNILVVSHSGAIKSLYSLVKKCSLEEAFSLSLPYASFVVLDTKNMRFIKS